METLILTLDTIVVMVVIYFSYRGEKLPGKPELGPFRIRIRQAMGSAVAPVLDKRRPNRR